MIASLLALTLLGAAPSNVVIATPGGERRIPVTMEPGVGPLIPAGATLTALRGTSASDGVWAEVTVGTAPFRFLLGAPLYTFSGDSKAGDVNGIGIGGKWFAIDASGAQVAKS